MALAWALVALTAHAQALKHLYAAEPPAGSSFVRVVNPSADAASVEIPGAVAFKVSASGDVASPYVVVPAGKALSITVDGRAVAVADPPAASTFVSIVLGSSPKSVVDEVDHSIGLNAELIFYNLVAGCTGTLGVAEGPAVFEGVATDGSRQRAINPVSASLVAGCGDSKTPPLPLPSLKSGDYYSVFLVGDAAQPRLVGAIDQTAPYQDPAAH